MADGDDPARRSSRFPKRGRVTLKWEAPPLALPGEGATPAAATDEPVDLALPSEGSDHEELARPSSIPPPESSEGADAWERQRPSLTPPPFRPPTGPPPSLDEAEGGALDLVDRRSRPAGPPGDPTVEMSDRYALGDYTAALRIAELILGRDAENEIAQRIAQGCRERLLALYRSRLGSLARVPEVAVDNSEVRWLGLDHRAAFLLSRIDGGNTLAEIVDVSGMPRLEALKTLVELLEMGAIRFRD